MRSTTAYLDRVDPSHIGFFIKFKNW